MQSSSAFIIISGSITEVKKSTVINDWKNISYWEEPEKASDWRTSFVCSKYSWGSWGSCNPRNVL